MGQTWPGDHVERLPAPGERWVTSTPNFINLRSALPESHTQESPHAPPILLGIYVIQTTQFSNYESQ